MRAALLIVALVALAAAAAGQPPDDSGTGVVAEVQKNGDLYCNVRGRSGKIALGSRKGRRQKVVINFDSMVERDSAGNVIGTRGKQQDEKHSFNSFASKDFSFTSLTETSLQGVGAKTFNFSANLIQNTATLNVQAFLFTQNGTLSINGEEVEVRRGMLKFNTVVENWPFCTAGGSGQAACANGEVGAFLDFGIIISSKSKPSRRNATKGARPMAKCKKPGKQNLMCRMQQQFSLGDGADMGLSTQLEKDGVVETMATGFPEVKQVGSKNLVFFRFPRFNNKVMYDPTVDLGIADAEDNAAGAAGPAGLLTLLAMAAACLLMWF